MIKRSKQLQELVDERKGSDLQTVKALKAHIAAVSIAYEEGTEDARNAVDAHMRGVEVGIMLEKAVQQHFIKSGQNDYTCVYLCTQQTSDGHDCLYFVGQLHNIMEQVRKIPKAS
jgi:hypothetical protein